MADGVPITAGSGTTIATDDCGASGHAQVTKLAIATDGSATLIPANATDGLLVNLGANNDVVISDGGGSITVDGSITAAPLAITDQSQDSSGLTTATTSYTSGDVLGAGWTFTSMAASAGKGGRILGVTLLDDADVLAGVDLFFAAASITFGTDNAAPSVSDTDAAKLLAVMSLGFVDIGSSRFASAHGLSVPYHCDATSLYVYARTLDSNNFFAAVDDLHLRLYYQVDP